MYSPRAAKQLPKPPTPNNNNSTCIQSKPPRPLVASIFPFSLSISLQGVVWSGTRHQAPRPSFSMLPSQPVQCLQCGHVTIPRRCLNRSLAVSSPHPCGACLLRTPSVQKCRLVSGNLLHASTMYGVRSIQSALHVLVFPTVRLVPGSPHPIRLKWLHVLHRALPLLFAGCRRPANHTWSVGTALICLGTHQLIPVLSASVLGTLRPPCCVILPSRPPKRVKHCVYHLLTIRFPLFSSKPLCFLFILFLAHRPE